MQFGYMERKKLCKLYISFLSNISENLYNSLKIFDDIFVFRFGLFKIRKHTLGCGAV
jgi:hypothetical protein